MAPNVRPRRSVLFTPAANPRALEKGRSLPVDGIIIDLEDSAAPDVKEAARERAVAALAAGGYGHRERVVRVNRLDTPWGGNDIAALAATDADALLLPKVGSAADVEAAEAAMAAAGATPAMALWCMIETPAGVLNAPQIAAAGTRVACFVAGTEDLGKDLGARRTPDRHAFITSLALCVLAARAHGHAVLDSVHADIADADGFAATCRQARDMGFDGKTLIHPSQIEAANAIFAPDAEALAGARRIIAAHADAMAAGEAVVALDGQLIEPLHVSAAESLVALAAAIDRQWAG